MAVNENRYRQMQFIGGDILEARELNWLQSIAQGVAVTDNETPADGQLQSLYRQGATFNTTVSVAGLVVTLSPTNNTLPMMIFVRDRWETFPTTNDTPTNNMITLTGVQTTVYLNWQLIIRTGGPLGDDPNLTDLVTQQAVASGGELTLALSNTDTSGTALSGSQLAKNLAPIPAFTFTNNGSALTYVPQDNILAPALASTTTSGLVSIDGSHGGTGSQVIAPNDTRLGQATTLVADGLVHDSTVRTPVHLSTNSPIGGYAYTVPEDQPPGTDIGGISAGKIIMLAVQTTLEYAYNYLYNNFLILSSNFSNHFQAPLGLNNTHPFPTPSQVGAAPLSHVNLILNSTSGLSHPPIINQDSGGFQVNNITSHPAANDAAYAVISPHTFGTGILASMNHDGDFYCNPAEAFVATPGGTGITITGALGNLSTIAGVLSQHVNQISHANPHGLATTDINAVNLGGYGANPTTSGYIQLPANLGGFIIQWGEVSLFTQTENQIEPYNIPFPHQCLTVQATIGSIIPAGGGDFVTVGIDPSTVSHFTITLESNSGGDGPYGIHWLAIGW